ncbi:hypothetical protein D5H78_10835 [Vallicoccus soli]|uniref:DUF4126 domain-containing protein n=1 Tax=Vallicoccus soli TaxID=2339232 RepID=A0A3A3Z155_9ACTN|nr:hypothetical protein D5H78_10835 [Vallicoccus soli]
MRRTWRPAGDHPRGRTVRRGLAAGALGTAVLDLVTWSDVALRGRPTSEVPGRTVETLLDAVGVSLGSTGAERDARRGAAGAAGGWAAGLGVAVAASAARRAGLRLPAPVAAVVTGAAAMAAADVPAAALGVTDPRSWSATDWVADAVPHLAYGVAVTSALRSAEREDAAERGTTDRRAPGSGLVLRSLLLGVAAGGRSTLGVAAPLLLTPRRVGGRGHGPLGGALALLALAGELTADKLPGTPSRLMGPALAGRVGAGALGGVLLARREGAVAVLPALAGAAGALAGSYAGASWREAAARRVPDLQAALAEDAAALGLAALAAGPGRRGR